MLNDPLMMVLAVGAVIAVILFFAVPPYIKRIENQRIEELRKLEPESQILDSAVNSLSDLKTPAEAAYLRLKVAENTLASADANLIHCKQTPGGNQGFGWPALLAQVDHAEKEFSLAQADVVAYRGRVTELRESLSQCYRRLANEHQAYHSYAARDKCNSLFTRCSSISSQVPYEPTIDWAKKLQEQSLPDDILARAEARQAARQAAKEERDRQASSCSSCYSSS